MDRDVAEKTMSEVLSIGDLLNTATSITKNLPDHEAKIIREAIAGVMTRMYLDIMLPIIVEYPDLDPDKE